MKVEKKPAAAYEYCLTLTQGEAQTYCDVAQTIGGSLTGPRAVMTGIAQHLINAGISPDSSRIKITQCQPCNQANQRPGSVYYEWG